LKLDIFDVARACARRWYVFLPLLLATTWFAYSSYSSVTPVYYVNAVVSIAPPNQRIAYSAAGEAVPVNGLLEAGGPTLITNLAVIAGSDTAFKEKVTAAGGTPYFIVKNFPTPPGVNIPLPLIMIEATSKDPATAQKTIGIAADLIDPVFTDLQRSAGVSDSQMVRAIKVSPPTTIPAMPSRTRSTVGIFLGGLGLTILASVLTDAFANRLLRKKAKSSENPVRHATDCSEA
jgi:hypothetical protein